MIIPNIWVESWKCWMPNLFFSTRRAKLAHRAGETHFFDLESHACQSKWMSLLQSFLNVSHKYQRFSLNLQLFFFKFVTLTRAGSQPVALFFFCSTVFFVLKMCFLLLRHHHHHLSSSSLCYSYCSYCRVSFSIAFVSSSSSFYPSFLSSFRLLLFFLFRLLMILIFVPLSLLLLLLLLLPVYFLIVIVFLSSFSFSFSFFSFLLRLVVILFWVFLGFLLLLRCFWYLYGLFFSFFLLLLLGCWWWTFT